MIWTVLSSAEGRRVDGGPYTWPVIVTSSFSTAASVEPPSYLEVTTNPVEAQMEEAMDTEKTERAKKPIIDQMTDLAAEAAGTLAQTAVKAVAKRAKKSIAKSGPTPVKKAAKTVAKAAKAPKKTAKKAAKKRGQTIRQENKGFEKGCKEKDGKEIGTLIIRTYAQVP